MSSNPAPTRKDFPADFRWGVSTSSFQIEGAGREDGKGESIWDRFCSEPGRIRDGANGLVACDHYHLYPQDLDMAQGLGVNAYRFSIAWPRILPTGRGAVNEAGLAFYDRLVDAMLERGLDPWCTLYHWDLPQALQEQGGWTSRDTVAAFVEYTDIVTRRLGDRVKHWITHNEPWCSSMMSYWEGVHAPGGKSLADAIQACHNILVSHGQAIPVIRKNVSGADIGITLSLHPITSASDSAEDLAALKRHDGLRNRWFLDPLHGRGYPADTLELLAEAGNAAPRTEPGDLEAIATATDFLGVNYYFPEMVADDPTGSHGPMRAKLVDRQGVERTGFGWEVSPQGLVDLLTRVQRDYNPPVIQLTENGSTFEDVLTAEGRVHDTQRLSYLQRHLAALKQAVDAGVPVKGYFAWSLLDNFEWAEGFLRRFGLAYVDYPTQRRILKDSGLWYGQFLNE